MNDYLYLLNRSSEAGFEPASAALNEFKLQQVNDLVVALLLSAFSSGESGSYKDAAISKNEDWQRIKNEKHYWTSRAEQAAASGDRAGYDAARSSIP